ncbi:reductive dehalogenase [Candidatus Bathyarchaeota archaeon]|nr:MAG: reductive dehalogenase [Candidatus Bathyarchaeota archaeon]RLI33990.1 MAG: reductive dehalogenase [Candidatus Bathyarchaeota archaeon]
MVDGTPRIKVRRVEKPPYVVDESRLRRFNSRNIVFERVMWDPSWEGYRRMYDEKVLDIIAEGKPGYSRLDFALSYASWIVRDGFEGGLSWTKIKPYRPPLVSVGIDWTKMRYDVDDPHEMSAYIKWAGRLIGASLVGICKLNRLWLYEDVEIPERFENVIVMAIEMDAEAIETSPAVPATIATGVGYSKMAFVLACMGEFIRNLGYDALQCGNDTALSIPLAIDAGLGELGRNGLLITPQYGPRVRLCKIFTDLPLESDKPIEFGVREFCKKCKLCAEHCEAGAISMDDEPSFEGVCRSNNPGALKWYVDVERCYLFWCENGTDCSTCIKVCPYNRASMLTRASGDREGVTPGGILKGML